MNPRRLLHLLLKIENSNLPGWSHNSMCLISAGFGLNVFLCTPKWEMMGAAILAASFIKGFTRNVHEHPAFATHYRF